ncbi:DUF4149 domain-containing protein [Mesoterricola silvestris]|uniref:TMEM205-like domain-containing protein n=1 Tax=Mesoterricola silvestris TaxID=2927979 RepID=A0AA48KAK6_9BACT|nr:DUF4149 domain-containing protein [Mesoterricola silvestris]BDU74751.1 hypothetical protein METEAL_39250 [Mesoterricola silvestris]
MKPLARTDAAAAGILLLWTGMVLGFAFLVAPLLFSILPSRDVAGHIAGRVVGRLDWMAWIAFGAAAALALAPRWLKEIREDQPVGPQRLWAAAVLVALLMCFTSQCIVSPGLDRIKARMGGPVEALAQGHPDRVAYQKAHGISRQMMFLRLLLAVGLAAGVAWLPKEKA